jgi:hypothetical protein
MHVLLDFWRHLDTKERVQFGQDLPMLASFLVAKAIRWELWSEAWCRMAQQRTQSMRATSLGCSDVVSHVLAWACTYIHTCIQHQPPSDGQRALVAGKLRRETSSSTLMAQTLQAKISPRCLPRSLGTVFVPTFDCTFIRVETLTAHSSVPKDDIVENTHAHLCRFAHRCRACCKERRTRP